MVKPLKTLNTQWSTKVHGEWCGCIRKSYEAKVEKRNTLITQISMKPSSGLYRSSKIGLLIASTCWPPPECSQTLI